MEADSYPDCMRIQCNAESILARLNWKETKLKFNCQLLSALFLPGVYRDLMFTFHFAILYMIYQYQLLFSTQSF